MFRRRRGNLEADDSGWLRCPLSFPCQGGSRAGSIAALYRSNIRPSVTRFSLQVSSFEVVEFNLSHADKSVTMFCIYRPPPSSKNGLTSCLFQSEFGDLLDHANLGTNVMLLGDCNIPFDNREHPDTKQVIRALGVHGFIQHVDVPTHRLNQTLNWLVCRSSELLVSDACVQDKLISDHYLVTCHVNLTPKKQEKRKLTSRNVRGIDRDSLKPTSSQPSASLFHVRTPII